MFHLYCAVPENIDTFPINKALYISLKVLVPEQPSIPQEIAIPSVGIFSGTTHCKNGHNL